MVHRVIYEELCVGVVEDASREPTGGSSPSSPSAAPRRSCSAAPRSTCSSARRTARCRCSTRPGCTSSGPSSSRSRNSRARPVELCEAFNAGFDRLFCGVATIQRVERGLGGPRTSCFESRRGCPSTCIGVASPYSSASSSPPRSRRPPPQRPRRGHPRHLRHGPSGRHDLHRRWSVHRQLRLLRRDRHLHRPGRPLLRHRRRDRDQRLRLGLAPARHARRGRRRLAARHAGLQLVARDAGQGRDGRRTPARTTTSRSSSSTRPTTARSTRPIPFWGGPNAVGATTAAARQGLLLRQLQPARRRHAAEPEGGLQPRSRRRRLERTASTPRPPASRATPAARSCPRPARRWARSAPSRSPRSPAPTASATCSASSTT